MRLGLAIVLFCLVRSNGIYALAVSAPFLLVLKGRARATLAAVLCASLALAVALPGLAWSGMVERKADSLGIMLSLPSVQLARAHTYGGLDSQQKEAIERYIPADAMAIYPDRTQVADPFAGSIDADAVRADPLAFARTYLQTGLACPLAYTEGAMLLSLGYWYPMKAYPDYHLFFPWIESENLEAKLFNEKYIEIPSRSLLPQLDALVNELFGGSQPPGPAGGQLFNDVPVLAQITRFGWYFIGILFALAHIVQWRQWPSLPLWALFGGVMLTAFLAPSAQCRYVAPLMFAFPLLVVALLVLVRSREPA